MTTFAEAKGGSSVWTVGCVELLDSEFGEMPSTKGTCCTIRLRSKHMALVATHGERTLAQLARRFEEVRDLKQANVQLQRELNRKKPDPST